MGLFKKYTKTTASDGTIEYSKKPDFKKTAKEIATKNTDVESEISELKKQLEEKVRYKSKITGQALNPNKAAERGTQAAGRKDDVKSTQKEIDSLVKKLQFLGCKVRTELLPRGKVVYYEGGHDNMFTTTDLKNIKLEVFQENAAGNISKDLADYMLITLESAIKETSKYEAYTEKVSSIINAKKAKYIEYVTESFNKGLITDLQKEVMLELAEDNFMFEDATPDRIPELVTAYIEAAKEGNEDKKEAIKEQIDTAKELQDAEKELEGEEVVEEGANCSIVEKLEAIKAKLTPEEKAMAEKFDKLLEEGSKEEKEEPDEKEEKEDEDKDDEPDDEPDEGVKESVKARFESVGCKSSLTDKDVNAMIDFMVEAVDDNVYSNADRVRVERLLNNR